MALQWAGMLLTFDPVDFVCIHPYLLWNGCFFSTISECLQVSIALWVIYSSLNCSPGSRVCMRPGINLKQILLYIKGDAKYRGTYETWWAASMDGADSLMFFSISKHPDTVSAVLTEEKKVASPLRQDCILSMKCGTISCSSGQSSTPKACFNCE